MIRFLSGQIEPRLIRIGAVLGVILALPVIGFVVTRVSPFLILAGVGALFALMAVLKRLELAIVATLLAGIFIAVRLPTGTAAEIPVSLVLSAGACGLWFVQMLVVERRFTFRETPVNRPIWAFIAAVVVSWVWGRIFRDPLVHELGHPLVSVAAGLVMTLLPASLLLVINVFRDVRWLQALVWTLLGAGLIVLIVDLGYFWGIGPIRALHAFLRTNGVIRINSHGLLSMWCAALALALALFNRRLSKLFRGMLLCYVGAWVYWGFYIRTTWLSGWGPFFVAAAVIAFLRSRRFFVVVLLLLLLAGGYYWQTAYHGEIEESGRTRLEAYQVNWRITGKHLLFGTGPAGYASYYMSYFPDEATATHNNYIDILAQTGLVGFALLFWFFGAQLWGTYRLKLRLGGRGDFAESLSAAVLAGTAGSLAAMALGDWLLPFVYTQGIVGFDLAVLNWVLMATVWALPAARLDEAVDA